MTSYQRSAGLRLEWLDESWAVFCGRSGDSLQLNHEACAVLEVLGSGPMDEGEVARQLAADIEMPAEEVGAQLQSLWPQLISLGLVDEVR